MIKSVKYILTGLVFYTSQIYAQTKGYVVGYVTEKTTNDALPGALITLDKKTGVATDINGRYVLAIAEGAYAFSCDLLGYKPFASKITIKPNDTTFVNVVLEDGNKLLDEVVVSAGRFEQKLSDVTVSMDVIKPTLAENKNAQTLDVLINQVPGVVISDGQASIRGGSGYSYGAGTRVLMLVDEMPMISADAADIKWNYLPIENMEQVEIIKGASSALFGSSALNGVINMRTAYAKDKPQTTLTVFGATYDAPKRKSLKWWDGTSQYQQGASFSHSQKFGNLDLVIGANVFNDEGYRYLETETRRRQNINLRYRFKKIQGLAIGVNANMMETEGGLFFLWENDSLAYTPQGRTIQRFENQRANIDPYITYFNKHGGKYSLRSRYYITNNTNNTNQESRAELFYNELQYQKRCKNGFNMTFGGVYMEQQVIAKALYGRHTGRNYSVYGQFDYKWKKLTMSFGLRGEYNKVDTSYTRGYLTKKINNLPFQPVFRAGLNYQLFEYTFLRASYGQGYRFPTIAEKYVATSVSALQAFPNPGLQPERGYSAELGVKQGFKVLGFRGFLDVAGFWTEYQNMVEFVFDIYGPKTGLFYEDKKYAGFKSQNVGRARIYGVDANITGSGKIGPINVTTLTGYTYTKAIDPDFNPLLDTLGSLPNSNLLKYRNKHLFKTDVQLDYKKLSVGVSGRYYSFMENIDRSFNQSILHQYNDIPNGVDFDKVPSTFILPGLKQYREKNNKGNWIWDTRISYQVLKQAKLSFIVNNVFNVEYTLRPGDVRPPRMFILQLLVKL